MAIESKQPLVEDDIRQTPELPRFVGRSSSWGKGFWDLQKLCRSCLKSFKNIVRPLRVVVEEYTFQ